MHLVLFETSGNQRFIFDTNRLRENVGASELTYRAGAQWVLDAVAGATGQTSLWRDSVDELREALRKQPHVEDDGVAAEVIVAASGKALVLVKDAEVARDVVWQATTRALCEAPGLDLCGVVSDSFDWNEYPLHDVSVAVHRRFAEVRAGRRGPESRMLQLPFVERCRSSGLPAAELDTQDPSVRDGRPAPAVAAAVAAKRAVGPDAWERLSEGVPGARRNLDELERAVDELDWVAVVHADGNGVGALFTNFDKIVETAPAGTTANRWYVDKLRDFSIGLDEATESALLGAAATFEKIAFVPLVLGGDDLTVLIDGRSAIRFTKAFLTLFEGATSEGVVAEMAKAITGSERLSASAGIAIVKPHYPFSVAYDLCEDLIASAKTAKLHGTPPPSSLDVHVNYAASVHELAEARAELVRADAAGELRLFTRPFVLGHETSADAWVQRRRLTLVEERVAALNARDRDNGRRVLPSSQTHDVRSALFVSKAEADRRFRHLQARYGPAATQELAQSDDPGSVFETLDGASEPAVYETGFLDAIELAEFL